MTVQWNDTVQPPAPQLQLLEVAFGTIYALSSAWGVAGVAILRVSGPSAKLVIEKMTKPSTLPEPRKATLRTIFSPNDPADIIDRGIIVYFPGPNSYTGEDVLEIQVHGGISVVRDLLQALSQLPGLIAAEPGEFTRRAWYNGKFQDLTQIEAVGDLIHAETTAQRKQAQLQLQGYLGELYHGWSKEIHTGLAHLEALIDFGDDEIISDDIFKKVVPRIQAIAAQVQSHLRDDRRGEILRNGVTVCLAGRPNAGKSSLLNSLSMRDVSIVSPEAGTTRDVVEARLDLGGYPLILQDTAGVREVASVGLIEQEGINRALSNFAAANIRIVLFDVEELARAYGPNKGPKNPDDERMLSLLTEHRANTLIVLNKSDLVLTDEIKTVKALFDGFPVCLVSCKHGEGIDALLGELQSTVTKFFETSKEGMAGPMITRARHRQHLLQCLDSLVRFLDNPNLVEFAAEDLRLASKSIQRITGRVDVEQLLDIVFKDFCIGK